MRETWWRRIGGAVNSAVGIDKIRRASIQVGARGRGGHDLVVVGWRGRGRLISTLLGSVAGTVHYHVHAALFVVHPEDDGT